MKNTLMAVVIACLAVTAARAQTWTSNDIGTVGVPGSYTPGSTNGTIVLKGAGSNIWSTADAFQFLNTSISGNSVQLTAHLSNVQNTNVGALAGLMVRQSIAMNAANASVLVTSGSGLYFQNRLTAAGTTTRPTKWTGTAPKWLRLVYSGGYAIGYISDDGANWTRESATLIKLTTPFLGGLAVTSCTTSQSCEADFDGVDVSTTPFVNFGKFPNAWVAENIATPVTAGNGAYDPNSKTWFLTSTGTGVGGTANSGAYLHRTWYGNGSFVVRVEDGAFLSASGKAGLTVAQSTTPGALCVNLFLNGNNQAQLTTRAVVGGATTTIATASSTLAPYWLKLDRSDNRFVASISSDGGTWKVIGSTTVLMGSQVEVAMAAASGSASVASTAVFDNLTLIGFDGVGRGLTDAWQLAMFGNVNQSASADPDGDGLSNAMEMLLGTNPNVANLPTTLSNVPDPSFVVAPLSQTGGLERSVWLNITGLKVGDLTKNPAFAKVPDVRDFVAGASAPTNYADNFGQRLRGTVTAPVTGDYTFWISADDAGELWLGSSASRFSKRRIAWVGNYTAFQGWDTSTSQKSVTVTLQAGQQYWIELLGKESGGGDHLEAAWQYPGQARQPIPAQYLTTPGTDPNDLNDNNLPDDWEAANHNPQGGEYGDADNDGLTNFEEYVFGTDPNTPNAISGCLSRDVWTGVGGGAVANLYSNPLFLQTPAMHELFAGASYNPSADTTLVNIGERFRGTVTAPVNGSYVFWISGDDSCELWLSSDNRKFNKRKIATVGSYLAYGNFDAVTTQKSAPVELQAGQKYYIEMLHKQGGGACHVEMAWQRPDGQREIIPPQYLASLMKDPDDQDDDDLPDSWERKYGLDPTDNGSKNPKQAWFADFDGDGVSNHDEYLAGTDPTKIDTYGDGINDVNRTYLDSINPLQSGVTLGDVVSNLPGTAYTAASANWYNADDNILVSTSRRGSVDYTFTTAADGRNLVRIRGCARGMTSRLVILPLALTIDAIPLGTVSLKSTNGNEGEVVAMLPWLTSGSHVLHVDSLNTYSAVSLQIDSIVVNKLTGADANGDGIPDWIAADNVLKNTFTLPIPSVSLTSPVCVEGNAAFPTLVKLAKADGTQLPVQMGTNNGWYTNLDLDPAQGTTVQATYENGVQTSNRTFTWSPLNVLAAPSLTIRLGESLLLTAYPQGSPASGNVTITITPASGGNPAASLNTTADVPVAQKFSQAGVFTVTATNVADGVTTSGTMAVTVRSADFGATFELYQDRSRLWTLPNVGADLTVEYDSHLYMTVAPVTDGSAFNVTSSTTGDYNVLARTSVDGPIVSKGMVSVFNVASTTTTGDVESVYTFANGDQLVRMGVVVQDLPPGGWVQLDIFAAGVTFQDGTRRKRLYAGDFDGNGIAYVVFNYPYGTKTSVCHTLKVFDANGNLVGTR